MRRRISPDRAEKETDGINAEIGRPSQGKTHSSELSPEAMSLRGVDNLLHLALLRCFGFVTALSRMSPEGAVTCPSLR
jgi:hypothetical protein